jgi:hypothetical protein
MTGFFTRQKKKKKQRGENHQMMKQKKNMKNAIDDILGRVVARSVNAFLSRKYFAPARQRISLLAFTAQP